MDEQQSTPTPAPPMVLIRTHWVAVRYASYGPWYISRRCEPEARPVECYRLPDDNPVFGLL